MSQFKQRLMTLYKEEASRIREAAYDLHRSVNQTYDRIHPYGFHLEMVAETVAAYADSLEIPDDDLLSVWFGAYFHDSIEDARMTYNNVVETASRFMSKGKAVMAAEIVYALTNEKGRTRAERADDRYYEGIRTTPYAPMIKLADRYSNLCYSLNSGDISKQSERMIETYRSEMPHFIKAITSGRVKSDIRYLLPPELLDALTALLH